VPPIGLLAVAGVWAHLWNERRKNASLRPLLDPGSAQRAWDLLSAWKQGATGVAPLEPGRTTDPEFTQIAREFQNAANESGWSYQSRGVKAPRLLRTDGVLDGATLAVLEAHVQLSGAPATSTLTTGGHYHISFDPGARITDAWVLLEVVDAEPAPDGLRGPPAWLIELARGRVIAIGQWTGPQYSADDRVTVFGVARQVPAQWVEVTSALAPPPSIGAVRNAPRLASPGCYRISYLSIGPDVDARNIRAAEDAASGGFELLGDPPKPSVGGSWPADDAGTSMGAGRRVGSMPSPPAPRVRMQWCTDRESLLPIPQGAASVRVWTRMDGRR
jgi:hypothetical protein